MKNNVKLQTTWNGFHQQTVTYKLSLINFV